MTCQAHPALVKRVQSTVRSYLILGTVNKQNPPVNGPKDPWLHVLSLPEAKVVRWRPHPAGTCQDIDLHVSNVL